MALCGLRNLSIMACQDPHLVEHSIFSMSSGRFSFFMLLRDPSFFSTFTVGEAGDQRLLEPQLKLKLI